MQSCQLSPKQREANFRLLSKLRRDLDEMYQLQQAAPHVRECEMCAREYLQQVLAGKAWQFASPIAGETAAGPSQPPSGTLAELEGVLLSEAIRAHNASQYGVVALVHALDERTTALEVLARLLCRLKKAEIPARIYQPGEELDLTQPGPVLVPSFDALVWLVKVEPRGRLWVALVPQHAHNRCLASPPVPLLAVRQLPRSDAFGHASKRFVHMTFDAAEKLAESESRLLDAICVPGTVGKPVRSLQLAAMLKWQPGALDSSLAALVDQELISPRLDRVGPETGPDLAYQVSNRKFAAARLENRSEEERLNLYRAWRASLSFESLADRLAFYEFTVWLAAGRQRSLARQLVKELLPRWGEQNRGAAEEAVTRLGLAESHELRAWGELLDDLRVPVAVPVLELALEREPENPYLLHTLGRCYARRARSVSGPGIERQEAYRKAVAYFTQAASQPAAREVAEHSWIDLELELGRATEAERLFGTGRDLSSPWWATLYGKIVARLGRPGVLDTLLRCQQRDPDNFFFGVMLADFHAQRHEYRDAIERLEGVLKKHPDHLQALTLKARIYRDRGWLSLALKTLEHVLKEFPENEHGLHLSADIHAEKKEWREANDYYRRLEAVDPGNLPGRISQCDWLLKHLPGNRNDAERLLPPPTDPLSRHPHVVSIRARLLLAAGRTQRGLEMLQEIYRQYPTSTALRNQLALALARLDRFEEARSLMAHACRGVIDWNTFAQILRLEARHHRERGDRQLADRFLEEAHECYRRSCEIDEENLYTLRGLLGLFGEWESIRPGVSSEHERELGQWRRGITEGGLPREEPPVLWGQ